MSTLKAKLMPTRFDDMSPLMAAIVGYVLGEAYTTPEIAEITVGESDNLVYIRKAGAIGFDGIQSLEDLRDNWNRLLDAAGLTPEERKEAVALFYSRVETLPGTEVRRCRFVSRRAAPVFFGLLFGRLWSAADESRRQHVEGFRETIHRLRASEYEVEARLVIGQHGGEEQTRGRFHIGLITKHFFHYGGKDYRYGRFGRQHFSFPAVFVIDF